MAASGDTKSFLVKHSRDLTPSYNDLRDYKRAYLFIELVEALVDDHEVLFHEETSL